MSVKTPKSMLLRRYDLSRGGWTADANRLYMLWFELLALSPSYELARRYRQSKGRLSQQDRERLPADFEQVLAVYDDFGDVQQLFFREWWLQRGLKLLGSPGDRPETELLFKASRQKPLNDEHIQRARHYFSIAWKEAHQPDVAVIAVPLNIGRQKALKQVKKLIDRHAVDLFEPPTPKYQLADKDMHVKSLIDAMAVLYMRAAKPDFKLWQVGVEVNISKSYSKRFDSKTTKRNANNSDELRHLEMMTSRKYRQARHIAENAARGIFPSMKPPPHSVAFDPKEFKRVIGAKIRWKKTAIAQLQAQADLMEQTPADKSR
jgi:hypothetical protein